MQNSFFSLREMKQPVNQWLCIAFISLLCFWTLLYYFTQNVEAVGDNYVAKRMQALK
jgi:hypothetical protein